MIEIKVESPGQAPRVQRFASTSITVGRATDCELCVDDPAASRRHCRISRGPSGWLLEDLGSANGTVVAGARVAGSCALEPGEIVVIGDLQLQLVARTRAAVGPEEVGPGPKVVVARATPAPGATHRRAEDPRPCARGEPVPRDRPEGGGPRDGDGSAKDAGRREAGLVGRARGWAAGTLAVGLAGLGGWASARAWDRPLDLPPPVSAACQVDDPRLLQADAAADAAASESDAELGARGALQALAQARAAGCAERTRAGAVLAEVLARLDSQRLGQHGAALRGLAAGGDARVAAVDEDGRVVVWDRDAPGRPLAGAGPAHAVARSPDGRWLAVAAVDGAVRWWDLADVGGPPQVQVHGTRPVQVLGFDRDGRTISVDADGRLQVWARVAGGAGAATWTRIAELRAWPGVTGVQLAGDRLLAFGTGRAAVWQVDRQGAARGAAVALSTGAAVTSAALDEAGAQVAVGDASGVVTRWRLGRRARAEPLTAHAGAVHAVAWLGGAIASVGADDALRVAELDRRVRREGPPLVLVVDTPVPVDRLIVAGAGRWLVGGGRGGEIVTWDLQQRSRRLPASLRPGHRGAVTALAAADGWVVSGGEDGVVRAWDLDAAAMVADATSVEARACRALGWSEPGCVD